MNDYERNTPRSFTGLLDHEWEHFGKIVKTFLGRGKRSMFLCTIIRKVAENAQWQFEQMSDLKCRADHAISDSFKFFNIKLPFKPGHKDEQK